MRQSLSALHCRNTQSLQLAGPCPDKKSCTDHTASCNGPRGCCLDYDGLCSDGHRYNDCALQLTQFMGST